MRVHLNRVMFVHLQCIFLKIVIMIRGLQEDQAGCKEMKIANLNITMKGCRCIESSVQKMHMGSYDT